MFTGRLACVILSCPVPFIVREDAGQYNILCECYVHGLMKGEAMDMENIPVQNIELK